jgi:hypothetical protein
VQLLKRYCGRPPVGVRRRELSELDRWVVGVRRWECGDPPTRSEDRDHLLTARDPETALVFFVCACTMGEEPWWTI